MAENKSKIALFRIVNTVINQFAVFEENYSDVNAKFDFQSALRIVFDKGTNVLACTCEVSCLNGDKPVMKASITFGYELSPETVADFTKGDTIIIPKDLLIYFGSNAYGALRGVVLAKLEPTKVRLIVPLESLDRIIDRPLVIKTESIGEK